MVAVALFSGGKDSAYSIMKARELGVDVGALLFVKAPLPQPSPHALNVHAVEALAMDMGLPLEVAELRRGREAEDLARKLRELEAEALVAGDVSLEDHLEWHERVCALAGVDLVEPIFNRPAKALLREMVESGLRFVVISVRHESRANLLGAEISRENLEWFISVCEEEGWDVLGERGEYHTLISSSPLLRSSFRYAVSEVLGGGRIALVSALPASG